MSAESKNHIEPFNFSSTTEGRIDPEQTFPYNYAKTPEEIAKSRQETAELARKRLKEYKEGNIKSIGMGIELEGVLYSKDNYSLLSVHGGENPATFEEFPPERYDAQLEIVTGQMEDGRFPDTAIEVARSIAQILDQSEKLAKKRNGLIVFSDVPEGGTPEQIKLTDHQKIKGAYERGQTKIYKDTPQEAKAVCKTVGINDIVPFMGMHVHTGNHRLANGQWDANEAYAAGVLGLTQMAFVEGLMLSNTKDLLGKHFDIKDVRSIIRRTTLGAQDTTIPNTASELVKESLDAYKRRETHEISRHPVTGQHDRVRIFKELKTTEYVWGHSNPDIRLVLAHAYFAQLLRPLADKALDATNGDESKVLDYLQDEYEGGEYKYLFQMIPTKQGDNNCYEQDLKFNKGGFDAKTMGKTYSEQYQDMRTIVKKIGNEFPALKTQAKIVDHVFGRVAKKSDGAGIAEYLDIESGMNSGIVTDHKSWDIEKNLRAQAEGTRKQAEALLQVRDEQDLLAFFGIKNDSQITIFTSK